MAASKIQLVLSKESETKIRVTVSYKYQIQLKKKVIATAKSDKFTKGC